jgi:adenine-specific DNA-methyltransferase
VVVSDLGEAIARGERLRLSISGEHRKRWGQYVTPAKLVRFMAQAAAAGPVNRCVRILDPGAGTGSLGLALAEELLERRRVARVELVSVEHEPEAHRNLSAALFVARQSYDRQRLVTEGLGGNFLSVRERISGIELFDIAIGNPPYFKLSPTDNRGGGDAPNIYARFMAVAAGLLREGGRLCFVVPRSYLSGSYFRRFRESFHEMMQLDSVHTFDSRRMAFGRDEVLQESIVVVYEKRRATDEDAVVFSSSAGLDDLPSGYPESRLGYSDAAFVIERKDLDINGALALPNTPEQLEAGRKLCRFDSTIASLGLKVSTGPVVPFRCTAELAGIDEDVRGVPLLWMQHVKRGAVTWPLDGFRKPQRVRTPSLNLTPLKNYVLVRRVSAKEDTRRITAAPLIAKDWDAKSIGLENHLNYIHRTGDPLQPEGIGVGEARGIAAILNSQIYDQYIRMVSGTTQVSATELRALPMPRLPYIEQAGRRNEEQVEALLARLLASGE